VVAEIEPIDGAGKPVAALGHDGYPFGALTPVALGEPVDLSPVRPPNGSARAGRRNKADSNDARRTGDAIRAVGLGKAEQVRDGSMLLCVANPTRQPARSLASLQDVAMRTSGN
jgi:hypothetical protein